MNRLFASIDLGGTNIHAALGREDEGIVVEEKVPTSSHLGPAGVLDLMADLIERLAGRAGERPTALGIGMPGLVDVACGITRFLPNMPTQWRDIEVRAALEPRLDCPVYLLNDARAATLGELIFGHGKSVSSMVFLTLGTGVGGGVVIDGKLRLGPLGAAGELGHQTIFPDGIPCSCGSRGCLETVASGPALAAEGVRLLLSGNAPELHRLANGDIGRVSARLVHEAALAGDSCILKAIHRMGEFIGIGVANVVSAIHPELIVLGGGVSELDELLLEPVRQTLHQRVGMFPTHEVKVKRSAVGDRAGLFGGLALAMQRGIVSNASTH